MDSRIIIADASCLIVLSNIGELDVLREVFREVTITPEVGEEFDQPLPGWMRVVSPRDRAAVEALRLQVDLGEATALALAIETLHHSLDPG